MTVGSNTYLNRNETDPSKINFAIQQALARTSGQQVNSSTSVSASYTLTVSDYLVNVTADNVALQLPAANAAPGQIYCIKLTSTGSTVSINPTTGNTIDGTTKQTINNQYQSIELQSDGVSAWNITKNKTGTSASLNSSSVLQSTNFLSELATGLTTTRSNLGLGSAAVLNSSSVLQTTNALSELSTQATTARANISAAGFTQTITDGFSANIAFLTGGGTYDIIEKSPFAATLTSFAARLVSGSFTAKLQINGVDVGGSSIAVSSSQNSAALSSANSLTTDATLTIITTAVSSPSNFAYTVAYTRTLTLA